MKTLTILALSCLLVVSVVSVSAQTPDNDALFGAFNLRNDAARIRLATSGPTFAPVVFSSMGFDFTNGPPEEINYTNHTFGFGYNSDFNGTKVVPGLVNFMFSSEAKFRNGVPGDPGAFMTEYHYNWASPDGSISIRPFGWTVQYDTGNFGLTLHGQINFFRNFSNGGAQWGIWHDDGFLDLRPAPNGGFGFRNNHQALRWGNAAGDNSIAAIFVDNQDRVLVGGWQRETIVTSASLVYNETIKRQDTQVLGAQCGPIPDSDGSPADNGRAINALLGCLRRHGLVDPTTGTCATSNAMAPPKPKKPLLKFRRE